VIAYSREEGLKTYSLEQLDIAYRHSRFLDHPEVVVAARFRLKRDPAVKERLKEMTQYRLSTQPWKASTAGCFFRNPQNCVIEGKVCSAGYLIEKSELKGYNWKGAMVSQIHANFLVNQQGAQAQAFLDLCQHVREKVKDRFGVWLQGEVRFLKTPSGPLDYV
jgi:UDP-N-acetylmuramate dehydrogenase